ncbi:MAG: anthranilate synthase component I family protein [Pseudolysinimonas sp.]
MTSAAVTPAAVTTAAATPAVALLRLTAPVWLDPEVVFLRLFADAPEAFWLDAGIGATTGRSYLGTPGRRPAVVVERVDETTAEQVLARLAAGLRETVPAGRAGVAGRALTQGMPLGWVGWFGYEFGAAMVGSPHHASSTPDVAMMFVERALVFDHAARRIEVVALVNSEPADAADAEVWAAGVLRELAELTELGHVSHATLPELESRAPAPARSRHTRNEYLGLVDACLRSIQLGDAYQLCLTNELRVDGRPDPMTVYRRLRRLNPTPRGAYLRVGATCLLSSTPELFLDVDEHRVITTRPIKGTRPRSDDPLVDAALKAELSASEKERAENVMIVDLMRNDLSRVAEVGSVAVPELCVVESYRNVHQLVSTVTATLAEGCTALDVVRAALAAGSMTGAPKRSAMTILDRLERGPRGLYAGAFGIVGLDGRLDLAVTIRSIVIDATGASIGTGGGITALSVPDEELDEMLLKAAPLLAALGAELGSE